MAACTLRRRGSLTGTDPVITCETVPTETPAISATFLMLGMARTISSFFRPDIARFDLHGRSLVHLYADQAVHLAPGRVVVDQHARHAAVEHLDDGVAAGDEVQVVPVLALDELLQFLAIAHRADERGLLALADVGELAAHGEKAAAALFVDLAGVSLLAIHVGLVALHGPLDIGKFDAAKLDAAVEAGEAELELQFEIGGTAAAPDEEGVLRGLLVGGGLADDGAVFHAPERRDRRPIRPATCRRRSAGSRSPRWAESWDRVRPPRPAGLPLCAYNAIAATSAAQIVRRDHVRLLCSANLYPLRGCCADCENGIGDIVGAQRIAECGRGALAFADRRQEIGGLVDEGVLVADLQARAPTSASCRDGRHR